MLNLVDVRSELEKGYSAKPLEAMKIAKDVIGKINTDTVSDQDRKLAKKILKEAEALYVESYKKGKTHFADAFRNIRGKPTKTDKIRSVVKEKLDNLKNKGHPKRDLVILPPMEKCLNEIEALDPMSRFLYKGFARNVIEDQFKHKVANSTKFLRIWNQHITEMKGVEGLFDAVELKRALKLEHSIIKAIMKDLEMPQAAKIQKRTIWDSIRLLFGGVKHKDVISAEYGKYLKEYRALMMKVQTTIEKGVNKSNPQGGFHALLSKARKLLGKGVEGFSDLFNDFQEILKHEKKPEVLIDKKREEFIHTVIQEMDKKMEELNSRSPIIFRPKVDNS